MSARGGLPALIAMVQRGQAILLVNTNIQEDLVLCPANTSHKSGLGILGAVAANAL